MLEELALERRDSPPDHPLEANAWFRLQVSSVRRHAKELRPFRKHEFGKGPESPSEAHRVAANRIIATLQRSLVRDVRRLSALAGHTERRSDMRRFVAAKHASILRVKDAERVWSFYRDIFAERLGPGGPRLRAADRIGLDCYQALYERLPIARSIPSPAPFAYEDAQRSPATYRRGVVMRALGRRPNPFPLVKLPAHRLASPWTLGGIPHEIGHNLAQDLSLWREVPERVAHRLERAGLPEPVGRVYRRWTKEMWADLLAVLLTGPAYIGSLMDVVALSRERTTTFLPRSVHPTPLFRVMINIELLRRMGFVDQARAASRHWRGLYPEPSPDRMPQQLLRTARPAARLCVDVICFERYEQLGNRSLSEIVSFAPHQQAMVEEAAGRLATGTAPGVLPERFMFAAVRRAMERGLASPAVLTKNFYEALARQ